MKLTSISLLFLSLVLAGCTMAPDLEGPDEVSNSSMEGDSGDMDSDSDSAPSGDKQNVSAKGPVDWEKAIENTTYLLHVQADSNVTIERKLPHRPTTLFQSVITFLYMDAPTAHSLHSARIELSPVVGVQETGVYLPENHEPGPPTQFEKTIDKDDFYVVLDSKGINSTFRIHAEGGTLEVLAVDPDMGTIRTRNDGQWDIHERVKVNAIEHFHGTTQIPLKHNFTMTHMTIWGDVWEFDVGLCNGQSQEYPSWPGDWEIWSDEPLDLTARHTGLTGGFVWFYTVDLPLDPPEMGCREIGS